MLLVTLYIAAAAAANLIVAAFGPAAVIPVGFALVGFDLTARDRLHDRWEDQNLPLRMGAIIAAGGLAAYLANPDAGRIAVASVIAFTAAASVDALVYHAARRRPFLVRANVSNVPSAAVDSVLFLGIAFGFSGLPLAIVGGQVAAKIVGGVVWSLVIVAARRARSSAVPA